MLTPNPISGTLRYAGFPEFVKVLVDINFLKDEEESYWKEAIPWKEATQKILGAKSTNEEDLVAAILSKASFADDEQKNHILSGLKWIGLFSDEKVRYLPSPLSYATTAVFVAIS